MVIQNFFVFLFFYIFVTAQSQNPVVRIEHGMLQGSLKTSLGGRSFATFQGIPYAAPPVGEFRFREPQPLKPWLGVWDATKYLSECLQFDAFTQQVKGSEDCLFINVFSPNLEENASLPVIVYIHGGAFMYGAGSLYDPIRLMDRDVVVVTFNYRLGPLGFISTGDEAASGNAGLKDQSCVLHWVQRNIRTFGGNPNSVTLIGQSAGAASVNYHYLSAWSVGTFHRGVMYSGTALSPWAYSSKPVDNAKTLASIVGCPTTWTYEMIECLRNRPGEVIAGAQDQMFEWKIKLFSSFNPTAEPSDSRYPFLTQHPYEAVKSGAIQSLPLIITTTSDEGLYPAAAFQANPGLFKELESCWSDIASNLFLYSDSVPPERKQAVADKIKEYYLHGQAAGLDTFPNFVKALTDREFDASAARVAELHALHTGQPVYFGHYSFRGDYSLSNLLAANNENYGVCHGDDVLHIFKAFNLDSNSTDDTNMSNALIDILYSYAATGVPKIQNIQDWLPVIPGSPELNYLEIYSPTRFEMNSTCDFGHQRFWESVGLLGY